MTARSFANIIALGTVTGMRSMSGLAALGLRRRGVTNLVWPILAAGEMVADKTPFVGDRIDPGPLAGRGIMGALAGGSVARQQGASVIAGALIGAAAALVATHGSYHLRKALPLPQPLCGLLEDVLVCAVAASVSLQAPSRPARRLATRG